MRHNRAGKQKLHLDRTWLTPDASDEEILQFIDQWILYLAHEDYQAAYAYTNHDPFYQWTPHRMEKVINGMGVPEADECGPTFTVTDPKQAKGRAGQRCVSRQNGQGRCLGYVYYTLPLNGEWSGLTASFRLERNGSVLEIYFEDLL